MLEPALIYANALKEKFARIAYDPHYMFAEGGYTDEYKPSDSNWSKHEFVSTNSSGVINGYIKYSVYQKDRTASGLYIVNFTNDLSFGGDLLQAIDDIFCKYGLRKLNYSVYIGNPIEDTYNKLTLKYGGYIVGVQKKHTRLLDGEFYDFKIYELFKEDYITHRPNRFKK